jgi:transcriptional regulator with XRE-family HTH domain
VSDAPTGSAPTRTLALAAKTLGGVQALAERLGVEPPILERWMAGEAVPPYDVFLKALEIVAGGPRLDPDRREAARRAQSHADRLQSAANRVRESAERLQSSAELAQAQAELMRAHHARANPEHSSSGQFRQVQPKDGAPASNKAAQDDKKAKG